MLTSGSAVDLELYVHIESFAQDCEMEDRENHSLVSGSDDSDSDDRNEIWTPTSPTSTAASSLLTSPHEVPKLEALLYYAGCWHWYVTTLALAPTGKVSRLSIERRQLDRRLTSV